MRPNTLIENELVKPLNRANVSTRAGRGGSGDLSYIASHTAKREMNAIFGPLGWSSETLSVKVVDDRTFDKPVRRGSDEMKSVREVAAYAVCRITVHTEDGPVVSDGVGLGNGECRADGGGMDAFELALKEAESDAQKRAMVKFGDRLGLALYDKQLARVVTGAIELPSLDSVKDLEELDKAWAAIPPENRKPLVDMFRLARARIQQQEAE